MRSSPSGHDESTERADREALGPEQGRAVVPLRRWGLALFVSAMLLLGTAAAYYAFFYPARLGPEQPIPFSHRVHAGVKEIGCVMCHDGVFDADKAGMPPLERCMLCHEHIIIAYPKVRELREHYFSGTPVAWKKVTALHEYAFFSHRMHLRAGIDCGHCHGDVRAMDRVELVHDMKMGYCIQCHRDYGATHDCWSCHR